MKALSVTADELVLKYLFTADAITRPTAWHCALLKAYNKAAGTVTEVNGTDDASYARVVFTPDVDINPLTNGVSTMTNTGAITFPVPAGGADYNVTHVAVYDASTAGRLLAVAPIGFTRNVTAATPVAVAAAKLKFETVV